MYIAYAHVLNIYTCAQILFQYSHLNCYSMFPKSLMPPCKLRVRQHLLNGSNTTVSIATHRSLYFPLTYSIQNIQRLDNKSVFHLKIVQFASLPKGNSLTSKNQKVKGYE